MKVVLFILPLFGLMLGGARTANSFVLNTQRDAIEKPNIFYDAIFNSTALTEYENHLINATADSQKASCLLAYERRNVEILSNKGDKILRCMHVSDKDLEKYFENHNNIYFEGYFTLEMIRCTYKSNGRKVMDCYIDTVSSSLNKIKGNNREPSLRKKLCIHLVLDRFVRQTNEATDQLKYCISQVNDTDSGNSAIPWVSVPPSNISTVNLPPWNNSTNSNSSQPLQPWDNSTNSNSSNPWYPLPPLNNSTNSNSSAPWHPLSPWNNFTSSNSSNPWNPLPPWHNSTNSNTSNPWHPLPLWNYSTNSNSTNPWQPLPPWNNSTNSNSSNSWHSLPPWNNSTNSNSSNPWHSLPPSSNSPNSNSSNSWTTATPWFSATTSNITNSWNTTAPWGNNTTVANLTTVSPWLNYTTNIQPHTVNVTTQGSLTANTTLSNASSWLSNIWNKFKNIF